MHIEDYSKQDLLEISRILKKYRILRKNVGKKSHSILQDDLSGEKKAKVEYFPTLDEKEVVSTALKIFSGVFGIEISENKIVLKKNETVAGGMRLCYGDEMLDVSFENVRNQLGKI